MKQSPHTHYWSDPADDERGGMIVLTVAVLAIGAGLIAGAAYVIIKAVGV